MTKILKQSRAMVLVVVMYITTILSMLAVGLAFRSKMAIRQSVFLVDSVQRSKIVEAVYVQACNVLADDDNSIDNFTESWSQWRKIDTERLAADYVGITDWHIYWRLVDESSKINVNLVYSDLLMGLDCLSEEMVACIVDWIDSDDMPGPGGAENDYYSSLAKGYRCKNDAIDNVEELLLIKGITPKIYYGSNLTDVNSKDFLNEDLPNSTFGLESLLTVYGDGKININTASKQVLSAIPLLSESAIEEILSRQESVSSQFKSLEDIMDNEYFSAADKLSLTQLAKFNSNHFQLQTKIKKNRQQFWHRYSAVIERDGPNTKLLSWQYIPRNVIKDKAILIGEISKDTYGN